MPVTLTSNYSEVLHEDAVAKIDDLLCENYALDDMLEFIDQYNETNFVLYYEEYVRIGEIIGYDAVDALIGEMGHVSDIEDCEDRFRGWYESTADFAEEFYTSMQDIPTSLVIDWEATYDQSLRYDYTACEVGYRKVAIFSDY